MPYTIFFIVILETRSILKVFGQSLEDHLNATEREVAYPIELCCCCLLETGMEEEGLFRVAGGNFFPCSPWTNRRVVWGTFLNI